MHARPTLLPIALLLCAGAVGAQTSPWYIGAAQTVAHESNIYRLADGQATPSDVSRSDTLSSTSLLAGLDQSIGRQRLFGTASLRATRFQDNAQLDNNGYALNLGLDWSTVERVSGSVALSANRNLARFSPDREFGTLTERNIETTEQLTTSVRVGVVTQVTAEAGLEFRRLTYSAAAYDGRENEQTLARLGLHYRPAGGTDIGVSLRHTNGRYPHYLDLGNGSFQADKFQVDGIDLSLAVQPTGSSRIDARLGYSRNTFDENVQREFTGLTGAVAWDWNPGGKLRLNTRLSRDSGQDSYFQGTLDGNSDFSRNTTALRLRADYEVTGKVRAVATASYAHRNLARTLAGTASDASGSDNSTAFSLGLTWDATRSLVFGCDLSSERRKASGNLSDPYSTNSMGCYGQIYLR